MKFSKLTKEILKMESVVESISTLLPVADVFQFLTVGVHVQPSAVSVLFSARPWFNFNWFLENLLISSVYFVQNLRIWLEICMWLVQIY